MGKLLKRLPAAASLCAVFFVVLQSACSLFLPYMTAKIVNEGVAAGDTAYVLSAGAVMLGFTVVSLLAALASSVFIGKISYAFGKKLRRELFQKALGFSAKDLDALGTDSLITRNTQDVAGVQSIVEMGLKFLILSPIYLFFGTFMTYLLSPVLAFVFMGMIPLLAAAAYGIYHYANPLYQNIQKRLDAMNTIFRESVVGVKVIRSFHKEDYEDSRYDAVNQKHTEESVLAATIMGACIPLVSLIMSMATVLIMWIGSRYVQAGAIQVGSIMGAITYGTHILMGFSILSSIAIQFPKGMVSWDRIQEVLDWPVDTEENTGVTHFDAAYHGPLEVKGISFRYENAQKDAVAGISFKINPGETLAVIGGTGDGKSTLLNLLNNTLPVTKGRILIGGLDIRHFKKADLQRLISMTPQKSLLFQGTVRSNLLFGNTSATEEQMWNALKMAGAAEFVAALPKGLDSVVEKNGGNFSGGQKQRLCIARTLIKDAAIYVFDDSFSALDYKTDVQVRKAMRKKIKNAITIIVAQRAATVVQADKILVLNQGKMAGFGSHAELKAYNKVYQEILESQSFQEAVA